jgi:zinc protease
MGEAELEPVQYQLDNGLTVILQEDHSAPVVAVQVWVSVGSADERPEEAGLAHVHEHMLFKGTERRGVGEIAGQVESAGGNINAWTSFDQTVYHIVIASRYANEAVDILGDAIQHSAFDEEELGRELEVIQEEILRGRDLPGRVLSEAMFRTTYESHPYGLPIIGTQESVDSFERENVFAFFQRWYRPDNITVVIVGDFAPEAMRTQVDQVFAGAPYLHTERLARAVESPQTSLRTTLSFQDIQESHLAVAFHVPGLADDNVPALELLTILLGQGESSILFRELKRNRQLATSVYTYLYTPRDPGLIMAGASFPASDGADAPLDVLEAVLTEVFRLRHVPVSMDELRRAQTMLESETIYERETVQGRATRLGYFHVVAGDLAFEQRFFELASQVTPEDIRRVARQYLTPENMTIGYVLPEMLSGVVVDDAVRERADSAYAATEAMATGAMPEPDEQGIVRHVFPNGLTLIAQEDHTVPIVSVRVVFPGGLRFENDQNNGVNNFVAELLTGGTVTRSAEQIAQEIESMAGMLSGFSGRNSIGLELTVLSRDFGPAMALLADCAQHSQFPEDEVERIRRQILAEIEAQEDNLAGSAFRQLNQTLFRGHPFELDQLGTAETIGAMSAADLRVFYEQQLRPSRMTIAVVGDVDAAAVIEQIQRVIEVVEVGDVSEPNVPGLEVRALEEVVSHRDRQQAHLVRGFQGVRIDDDDQWPLLVLAAILSGQGGRLFLELRDRQSLAYSVSAFNLSGVDGGYFATYIATSPNKVDEAVSGMEREIRRLQAELIPEDEVERAQRYLIGNRAISLQRASNRAAYMAFDEAYGLGYDNYLAFAERISNVTSEDIQRVAQRYLNLETGVLSIVSPE